MLTRFEDIYSIYLIFLGRPPEQLSKETRVDREFTPYLSGLLESQEFHDFFSGITAGYSETPELAAHSVSNQIRDWAVARLPLSSRGRYTIRRANSWWDIQEGIFSDSSFQKRTGFDAISQGTLATMWANRRNRLVSADDLAFCYRVFLGRDFEGSLQHDARIGIRFETLLLSVLDSPEFSRSIAEPMLLSQCPAGPLLQRMPTKDLLDWAVVRLSSRPETISRIEQARTWYEFHTAIFSDRAFARHILARSRHAALRDAPLPYGNTDLAGLNLLYRVFLGRDLDGSMLRSAYRDFDSRLATILNSPEFKSTVLDPMCAGFAPAGPYFSSPPDADTIQKIIEHLPLLTSACARLAHAVSWFEIHTTIFSDPHFRRHMPCIADLLPADELSIPKFFPGQDKIIAKSRLFERDWYLDTYPRVAMSGGDPLDHFLMHGVDEGKDPNPLFNTRWYLANYPDVRRQGSNPLTHYILRGAAAGNQTHPLLHSVPARNAIRPGEVQSPYQTPLAATLGDADRALTIARFPSNAYDVEKEITTLKRRAQLSEMLGHIKTAIEKPTFIVLIDGEDDGSPTKLSVSQQIYDRLQVVHTRREAARVLRTFGLGQAYLIWLEPGDELFPEALYILFAEVVRDGNASIVYADEVWTDAAGRELPFHKPDWSPDFLESMDYIGSASCFRAREAEPLLEKVESRYDLVLRLTEQQTGSIVHIDEVVLKHKRPPFDDIAQQTETQAVRALAGRLQRTQRRGTIGANVRGAGSFSIDTQLSREPLVSIIIPTAARVIAYRGKLIDLIVQCVHSIVRESTYRNIEFVIVDNGDLERRRLDGSAKADIKFATYGDSDVNIAKKINLGASRASGDIILILNDDVVPIRPDWIERMLAHLEKLHVGIVGAKLLYPNGTIQHAGIVMCDGTPDHVRRGAPKDDLGYAFSTAGVRNYSAVTGAVSMLTAKNFHLVGGYSEEFPIDYNDVDFCFKLRNAGLSVVYEPKAELFHYESVSIVKPPRTQDIENFNRKWARDVYDPFYNNRAFTRFPATFELAYDRRRY